MRAVSLMLAIIWWFLFRPHMLTDSLYFLLEEVFGGWKSIIDDQV